MLKRFSIYITLVVLVLSVAAAAQKPPALPQSLSNLTSVTPGSRVIPGSSHEGPSPQYAIGWNFAHAQNCVLFYSGSSAYFYVALAEGGALLTNDQNFQHLLGPECQTANWFAFYVYDNNNDFNQILTFTYAFHNQDY